MSAAQPAFESALAELESLRKLLKKNSAGQVRSGDEQSIIKATAYSWFNTHRAPIASVISASGMEVLDGEYKVLLMWCERHMTRAKYFEQLRAVKSLLVDARANAVANPTAISSAPSSDQVPDFGKLVADLKMQAILANRWAECISCVGCNAPLAAAVMMGGLLEAVLLARVHREQSKVPIFTAKNSPKDAAGKTRNLNEWTLQAYVDVAHELDWITVSAMSVSVVVRDYRNYVHPHKEYSHGVKLKPDDAVLLWEVSKTIVRQVIKSAP